MKAQWLIAAVLLLPSLCWGQIAETKQLAVDVLKDQKAIWLSPFRMKKQDAKWWVTFGIATAALIAADHPISEQLPNRGTAVDAGSNISRTGQYYSVYPFALGMWVAGYKWQDKKLAKTGALSAQALIDAAIVANVLKEVARRDRPLEGDGGGHFEKGGASFPSGHSIEAWSLATVVAKRYGNHKWVPWVAYAYAAAVSGGRVAARQHFPSDVLAGGAMGYFIGRYVAEKDEKKSGFRAPTVTPLLSRSQVGVALRWDLNRH
jgi:membrane-associated phospholipid phosphatase